MNVVIMDRGRTASRTNPAMNDHTGEMRKLTTLVDVSQALTGTLNLKAGLHRVLEILEQHHSMVRSAVTLLQDGAGELHIEASNGLSAEGRRASYRVGEEIGRASCRERV